MSLETELALKTVDQILKIIASIIAKKKDNAKTLDIATSHVGKTILGRKEMELAAIRKKYNLIPTDGDAEPIVRKLLIVQTQDTFLTAEIDGIKKVKKVAERLDKDLGVCHSVLKMREGQEKTTR